MLRTLLAPLAGLVVGATFEHDFDTLAPDPAQNVALRAKAARLLPALAEAPILDAQAGVRVTWLDLRWRANLRIRFCRRKTPSRGDLRFLEPLVGSSSS